MIDSKASSGPFTILAIGSRWRIEDSERVMRILGGLASDAQFRCVMAIPEAQAPPANEIEFQFEIPFGVELELNMQGGGASRGSEQYDLAICSAAEDTQVILSILSMGLPLIVLDSPFPNKFPEDAVIGIEDGEYAEELLKTYLARLLADKSLRLRMGENARRAAQSPAGDADHKGRFQKPRGIDYRQGALDYDTRLDKANRHHLLTKPFYNLRIRSERLDGDGLDEDTRRHFCDFANIAFELALPLETRILDVGCGPGWLSEFFARLGYGVTGIDISPALIEVANQRLKRLPFGVDRSTPLNCRYLVHDIEGGSLDEEFDFTICYDSLHHFEDEHTVFRNLSKMVAKNGLLFILEGARPSEDSESGRELTRVMHEFHTLESPFDREYLLELLGQYGFVVIGDYVTAGGLHDRKSLIDGRIQMPESEMNYLLCKKTDAVKRSDDLDFSKTGRYSAEMTGVGSAPIIARPGETFVAHFSVLNTGDTLWVAGSTVRPGIVRFGFSILDSGGGVLEEVHGKPEFRRAMSPSERRNFILKHRAPGIPGSYLIRLDILVQDICWFSQNGSQPLELRLEVSPSVGIQDRGN